MPDRLVALIVPRVELVACISIDACGRAGPLDATAQAPVRKDAERGAAAAGRSGTGLASGGGGNGSGFGQSDQMSTARNRRGRAPECKHNAGVDRLGLEVATSRASISLAGGHRWQPAIPALEFGGKDVCMLERASQDRPQECLIKPHLMRRRRRGYYDQAKV